MNNIIHIDFETYSTCDLRKCGSDVYAEHPDTEVLCLAYAIGDQDVKLWISGDEDPHDLLEEVEKGSTVVGHNVGGFELPIWNNIMVRDFNWPELSINQAEDTMVMGYAMGLPGALDDLSRALNLPFEKDMKGHRVMLQLCKPRRVVDGKIYRWPKDHEKYQILYKYCKQDVEVEREAHKVLYSLSSKEKDMWRLDWKINRRGVKVDKKAAQIALDLTEFEKGRLNTHMKRVTLNKVATCNATGQLTDWLKSKGLTVPSVAKADVLEMLEQDIPSECRKALHLRQEAGKTSTAKLNALLRGSTKDGRVKGMFQFNGATTGRWAGRRLQLHNLPRPNLKQEQIEKVFDLINSDKKLSDKASLIEMYYGSPMSVISSCLRGFLICDEDKNLIGVDFSAIEARVLAWLAGEEKVLEVFRGHGKLYEYEASNIFKVPIGEVTPEQRQIGKVAVLALGFQGGAKAFQQMSRNYGLDISEAKAKEIKEKWRAARIKTVRYWAELERKSVIAYLNPGKKVPVGVAGREVKFLNKGGFLWCLLPSGRAICYPFPKLNEIDTPWGQVKEGLTYMGSNSYILKWARINTYGGKLCENITQAVAADLLRESIIRFEDLGQDVVMHVHDEVVLESNDLCVEDAEKIMSEVPTWAKGMPIAAEGWVGERFRK